MKLFNKFLLLIITLFNNARAMQVPNATSENMLLLTLPRKSLAVSPVLSFVPIPKAAENITIELTAAAHQHVTRALPFLAILSEKQQSEQKIDTELAKIKNNIHELTATAESFEFLQLAKECSKIHVLLTESIKDQESETAFLNNPKSFSVSYQILEKFAEVIRSSLYSLPWTIKSSGTNKGNLTDFDTKTSLIAFSPQTYYLKNNNINVVFKMRMEGCYYSYTINGITGVLDTGSAVFSLEINKTCDKAITAGGRDLIDAGTSEARWSAEYGTRIWSLLNKDSNFTHHFDINGSKTAIFNNDSTKILSACKDEARLWNIETGIKELTLKHKNIVNAIFNNDNSIIATMSYDLAQLWDRHSGKCLAKIELELKNTSSLFFNNFENEILICDKFGWKSERKNYLILHQPLYTLIESLSLEQQLLFFYTMQAKNNNTKIDLYSERREAARQLYFTLPREIQELLNLHVALSHLEAINNTQSTQIHMPALQEIDTINQGSTQINTSSVQDTFTPVQINNSFSALKNAGSQLFNNPWAKYVALTATVAISCYIGYKFLRK